MGRHSDLRALYTLAIALRLLFTILIASPSFSGVMLFPVNSSTFFANSAISSFHFIMSFSRFIWGTSIIYMGTSSPSISYAFFLASQVVSPTYISAMRKKGQVRPSRAPTEAFTRGQVLFGSPASPPGTQNWLPPQSPVTIPFAAMTTSSGTYTQKVPNTLRPSFCAAISSAGRIPCTSDITRSQKSMAFGLFCWVRNTSPTAVGSTWHSISWLSRSIPRSFHICT